MSQTFKELFESSNIEDKLRQGAIIQGKIVAIGKEFVTVNAGLKSEGIIPIQQFYDTQGNLDIAEGDMIDVALDAVEDGFGETRLSREKAKRAEDWQKLEAAFEAKDSVTGKIKDKVKGGFTVAVGAIRAFLPGSLIDVRPVKDTNHIEGKELEFKVIKIDRKRNNVVVSRRAVLEAENSAERQTLLSGLAEGQEIKGVVKNLTDYGAFVDLGGIDGLLHITDMAWNRVKHPSEVVAVGQEVMVKVLRFDKDRERVSLGLKQLGDDPWLDISERYPVGTRLKGKITNIADYGCFVEIETGVEGLVHVSEMDWTNKNIHPSKVVQLGEEVEVLVLDVDRDRRRISLGVKQCKPNPWQQFAENFNKNDKVSGKIKSITDFGIFIGLEGGIDGLVHLSDISWDDSGEEAVRNYKKGDELEVMVLAIDSERERISLGIKQLQKDAHGGYVAENPKGSILKGVIAEVDAKGATVKLADGVEGYIKVNEISKDRVEDARSILKEGDEVEAKFMSIDRNSRVIQLSIKAKEAQEDKAALREFSRKPSESQSPSLGDLIKEQMETQKEK